MKRLLLIVMILAAAVYAVPLFILGPGGEGGEREEAAEPDTLSFDEVTKVTLWDEDRVKELTLRDYLCGVVASEMPASFPEEALKAQALAARTYTAYQLKLYSDGMPIPESHHGAQLCSDYTHCKAYLDIESRKEELWGRDADFYEDKIKKAVDDTCGVIATYKGEPIAAVFHAASTEMTESSVSVWGTDKPYLVSVKSPGGSESPKYRGKVEMSCDDFKNKIKAQFPDADFSEPPSQWFKASSRSEAGGIIDVAVGGVRISGVRLREILGLNSTNFTYKPEEDRVVFETIGYGHGVGMSQYGAKALAEEGKTCDEIIKWYYTGVDLTIKSLPKEDNAE